MLFLYCDSKKLLSAHEFENPKVDEFYIRGFCLKSKGLRTLRKDRVVEEFSDQNGLDTYLSARPELELVTADQLKEKTKRRSTQENQGLEICFTGFSAQDRAALEAKATEAGLCVRKSVTTGLSFLCTGANAGPVKMKAAETKGVCLLTVDELAELLEHGVLPSEYMEC